MHRLLFLALLALVSGCGFVAVGNGAGDGGDLDLSVNGGGGGDDLSGIPPGFDLAGGGGGGSCPGPQLLVGVENLHNGDSGGGRVARLSLTTTGAQGCTTLRGQGLIAPQPFAVAAFAGGVAAATGDGVYVLDPVSDTVRWSKPSPDSMNLIPVDAFALAKPGGGSVIAVAYGMKGSNPSAIRELDAFDAAGTAAPSAGMPWCIQGTACTTLPLSLGILGMTPNPAAPTHLLALDYANAVAAWDVDPWSATKTQYIGTYSEYLQSIYAVAFGSTRRVAWFDANQMGAIQYADDTGSGPSAIGGPVRCSNGCATILQVVPDPTTSDGFFLLCDGAAVNERTVVRMDGTRSCTQLVDGMIFGAESRLSYLGIAPP